MRFKEYITEEVEKVNLYGKVISAIIITPSIKDRHWNRKFNANDLGLTSIEGSPRDINGDFDCSNNNITSLVGGPESVTGNFHCYINELKSLKGAPTYIGKELDCSHNPIKSLHNIHKHIHYIKGSANFNMCPIDSHILGLCLISDLKTVKFTDKVLERIMNTYLPRGKEGIFDCQRALIDADYPEFAQL